MHKAKARYIGEGKRGRSIFDFICSCGYTDGCTYESKMRAQTIGDRHSRKMNDVEWIRKTVVDELITEGDMIAATRISLLVFRDDGKYYYG